MIDFLIAMLVYRSCSHLRSKIKVIFKRKHPCFVKVEKFWIHQNFKTIWWWRSSWLLYCFFRLVFTQESIPNHVGSETGNAKYPHRSYTINGNGIFTYMNGWCWWYMVYVGKLNSYNYTIHGFYGLYGYDQLCILQMWLLHHLFPCCGFLKALYTGCWLKAWKRYASGTQPFIPASNRFWSSLISPFSAAQRRAAMVVASIIGI